MPLDCEGQKKGMKEVSGDWMKVSLVAQGAARCDASAVPQHEFALCMWEHLHLISPREFSVPVCSPQIASNFSALPAGANVTLNAR